MATTPCSHALDGGTRAGSSLFVCGSAAAWNSNRGEECARRGVPIVLLRPDASPEARRSSVDAAMTALGQRKLAIIALGGRPDFLPAAPQPLLDQLIETVADVLQEQTASRLFVEGGGTASALVRRMGWTHGRVCRQFAPAVVALQVDAQPPVIVTVKPGSYPWPDEVWPR